MDKNNPVTIAQELISYASITPEDCGVQGHVASLLEAAGFECHHLPFENIQNLYAQIGNTGRHVCFAGHTDVVPTGPLSQWSSPPFTPEIRDGVLYGRGASDMKGAIAAFISAACCFVEKHGKNHGIISLLITGDEEGPAINGTVKVLEWMKQNSRIPDVALVGEPTNPNHLGQEIKIGRRGSLNGVLTMRGKQGHVAYPHLADNPLPKLAQVIATLSHYEFDAGNDFFAPTNLEFVSIVVDNTAGNVIPETGQASFNVRFNDYWSGKTLEAKIRTMLDSLNVTYDLKCSHSAESFLSKSGDWVSVVAGAVSDVTGRTTKLTTSGGTSDARFITNYCPVVECGGVNDTIHKIDENARVEDIENLTRIYLRILERYFGIAQ